MDTRLRCVIVDYQTTAAARFDQIRVELGIQAPESNTDWACNGITQTGVLSDGTRYFKHGYGCAIKYEGGSIDFDFGERGEITGFDAYRLWNFARSSVSAYGFASEAEIASTMKEAEGGGELRYSGYILYYLNEPVA